MGAKILARPATIPYSLFPTVVLPQAFVGIGDLKSFEWRTWSGKGEFSCPTIFSDRKAGHSWRRLRKHYI